MIGHPPDLSPASAWEARWIWTGNAFFSELLGKISTARSTIRLETYSFSSGVLGARISEQLVQAANRGVVVRVLADGLNSPASLSSFWSPLIAARAQVAIFNPWTTNHPWIRNHRKLVVIDDDWAAVGGFNLTDDFVGDGVAKGWLDCGLSLAGSGVSLLAADFDFMWRRFALGEGNRIVRGPLTRPAPLELHSGFSLLRSGPGQVGRSLPTALKRDLSEPRDVGIAVAYFLPGVGLRKAFGRAARAGRRIQFLLPDVTDVPLAARAARYLYDRFLQAGIEIYEYQPQILHTKLYLVGSAAYVGSSNLDARSLRLNHELMVRLTDPVLVHEAEDAFRGWLRHARRINADEWRSSRGLVERLREKVSFWILARLDPFISRRLAPSATGHALV